MAKAAKTTPAKPGSTAAAPRPAAQLAGANGLLAGAVLVFAVLACVQTFLLANKRIVPIAITESGQVVKPLPLTEAFVTDFRVLNFADEALKASFSHDFLNYRTTFNAALNYYTQAGGKMLKSAIDPLFENIRKNRLVMLITPSTPVLAREPFLYYGRVAWDVEVVVDIKYHGQGQNFPTQTQLATLRIVRIPLDENPRGIAVHSVQFQPYTVRR